MLVYSGAMVWYGKGYEGCIGQESRFYYDVPQISYTAKSNNVFEVIY